MADRQHVDVAIVGAGFAGLGAAIRLRQEGYRDLLVFEQADEVGGTWRENTYPGCACDVPSRLYSFSFQPNPNWTRRYAPQQEIGQYLRDCVDLHGLKPYLRLGCAVRGATWDARRRRWELRTSTGSVTARVLVLGQGPLSEPSIPALAGLDRFAGPAFHSARWRHDLDLRDRRVAVIGTGASAIQFVPQLQRVARTLTVFQRTPPWIVARHDRPIPAWQRRLFRRAPQTQQLTRGWEYLVREAGLPALLGNRAMTALARRQALAHLHRQVADTELRARLTPSYEIGCKRILLSDDYYPAVTQPNVEVVTDPILSVESGSVRTAIADETSLSSDTTSAAASERPVDVLIFGTGFHVTDASYPQQVVGADGRSLREVWDGSPQAYLGTTVAGFPNLFLIAGPNTGVGHTSLIYMIESQVGYLISCLRLMRERDVAAVDVRPEVQHSYNAVLQQRMAHTVWAAGGCTAWYRDSQGRISTIWPEPTWRFRRRTRTFDPARYLLTVQPESALDNAADAAFVQPTPELPLR